METTPQLDGARQGDNPDDGDDAVAERLNKEVGSQIRLERLRQHLSQDQLAEMSGLDKKTIGRLERGERPVGLTQLYFICRALGVLPSAIIGPVDLEIGV